MPDALPYCLSLVETCCAAEKRERRVAAKILASSLLRNLPLGDVHMVRVAPEQPLFRVGREGFAEEWVEEGVEEGAAGTGSHEAWLPLPYLDGTAYSWVFFLGEGSIALREVDHLLETDADILWAPLEGIPLRSERCRGYVTAAEMAAERVECPWSRPWREAASASVWAVRGEHYAAVLAEWQRIAGTETLQACGDRVESAWNRLLVDTPLKVARFERGEVAFPALAGADYRDWSEAAILHVGEWTPKVRARFLQAQFFGTYFGDASGLFLDLMEP